MATKQNDELQRRLRVFQSLRDLHAFPAQDQLKTALSGSTGPDRRALAQLWLTEGCPVGIAPWVYQWFREAMAKAANVAVKDVSLTGSARLGYSISPAKKKYGICHFGDPFNYGSDLDALVVSAPLYADLMKEVQGARVKKGKEEERARDRERFSKRHFVETRYFIAKERPPRVSAMHQCFTNLGNRPFELKFDRDGSFVRIYRDWESAVHQISRSLSKLTQVWKQ